MTGRHTTFVLLLAAVAIGLFEWRVRSENKPFIRVATLGTVAVALLMVLAFMTASMLIAFEVGAPPMARMTRPWAVEQVGSTSKSLSAIEQALAKKDWPEIDRQADAATTSLGRLAEGPAIASLTRWHEAPTIEDLRAQ